MHCTNLRTEFHFLSTRQQNAGTKYHKETLSKITPYLLVNSEYSDLIPDLCLNLKSGNGKVKKKTQLNGSGTFDRQNFLKKWDVAQACSAQVSFYLYYYKLKVMMFNWSSIIFNLCCKWNQPHPTNAQQSKKQTCIKRFLQFYQSRHWESYYSGLYLENLE